MGGHTARSGELLLASIDGLIAFDPAEVGNLQDSPPIVFTNFLLANTPVRVGERSALHQTIDQTSSIALTYADRVISFEFSSLNYRAPRESRYRYKLEGFDDDWIVVDSTQRLVTYTNLPPGRYVFRVMTANAGGLWNQGRAIALTITPPWWMTWWFRGLVLSLIVGCATGFYTWRVKHLERHRRALEAEIADRQQVEEALRGSKERIQDLAGRLISAQEVERARIARELHDDVTQQLAAISISLGTLKRRLPPNLKDGKPELDALQQQAFAASQTIRQMSHELHPSILRHAGLPAVLQGVCADFGSLHGIEVVFHAEHDTERTEHAGDKIHPDVALCLYRVTQEALRNAVRHALPRHVHVTLASRAGVLELRIEDDGRGFDLAEARAQNGLGLTSIEERVRLLSGEMQIASVPGRGTQLCVRVPRHIGEDEPREYSAPTETLAGG
jgi:signal transduction histidine kinase